VNGPYNAKQAAVAVDAALGERSRVTVVIKNAITSRPVAPRLEMFEQGGWWGGFEATFTDAEQARGFAHRHRTAFNNTRLIIY
jgi:hypothetical protein